MQRRPSTVRGGPGGAGPDGVVLPPGFVLSGAAPQPPATLTAVTVAATRVVDGLPVWVHTVTAEVDAGTSRRLRTQFPELADLLARLAPTAPLAAPVTVSAAGEARPFLVTFRTGPRLAPAAPIPVPLARRIVHDAARALAALHAAGLVHGGVVPGAFFRDGDGVRLDPPLPSALADAVAAGVAAVGGTGHEPPEVLQGGAPGPAADVYALASSVWTLLAGHPPHRGDPDAARLARLRDAPVPRLARGDVGVAAESALRAALAADPARRPDLDALAQAFAVAEPTASGAGRLDTLPARPPQRPGPSGGGQPLGSRYLLDELVGRGATGHVWRAHIRDSGQTVAVKLLRSELAEDPDVVTRFMRERTTLTAVDHPHVVRVRDLVAEGGALAVIMDYVDGTDLRKLSAGRPVPLARAARLLGQTAAGLAAVHAAGIVHRDLKPENVLVDRAGARLTDFGLARAAETVTVTRRSQLVGTPAYIAPEVVAGRDAGPAADIYALGVTGYELLCGRRPFHADSTAGLLRAHLDEDPPRPPGLPDHVWALLERSLDKAPQRRPDAASLAAAWTALAGDPDAAPALPTPIAGTRPGAAARPVAPDGGAGPPPVASTAAAVPPGGAAPPGGGAPPAGAVPTGTPGAVGEPGSPDGPIPTELSQRPLPDRPESGPPSRRFRRWWWVAAAAVVVLGFAVGLLLGLPGGDGGTPHRGTPTRSAVPVRIAYPVAATIARKGELTTVTVTGSLSGFPAGTPIVAVRVQGSKRIPVELSQTLSATSRSAQVVDPAKGMCIVVYAYPDPAPKTRPAAEQPSCLPAESTTG